jgi:acetyl-CoA C-acetyltransferase
MSGYWQKAVVIGGTRTAIGNFGGSLKSIPAAKLGSIVIGEALRRSFPGSVHNEARRITNPELEDRLKEVQVDEVIMGNVLQGGQGQNPARQAAIYGGISEKTPAFTVNKVCASGLKAIALGVQAIQLGDAEVIVAGGMENMSRAPYVLPNARWGYRLSVNAVGEIIDLMVYDGLWEIFYGYHIGITAENIAERYKISRKEQDEIGLLSHQRAKKATADGMFVEEIVPLAIEGEKGETHWFSADEHPRDTSLEKMALLPPVFKKDGTVTAGNASAINDGAAAVVLMSEKKAEEMSLKPWVAIGSCTSCAVDPAYMGLGPIPAVRKTLDKANLTIEDIDIIELHEAFAAQFIACKKELGLDMANVNVYGGSIALGHPIGCTGARIVVTIMHEMRRRNLNRVLVALCVGGGQGMAMVLEKYD